MYEMFFSDEEVEDEEMEFIEGGGTLTAAETRRLAESWQRRYSTDRLDDDDGVSGHETESDLESDNYSEEYGAEGKSALKVSLLFSSSLLLPLSPSSSLLFFFFFLFFFFLLPLHVLSPTPPPLPFPTPLFFHFLCKIILYPLFLLSEV